ncbi:MAG: Rpn family recombination-promoting nuclease/putative transposase [Candidatus Accumulibacter sp.]|uniref:Rpn family recombination-promoting nuclease/putative transposase n=2 Tax=Accumulibacter sp. TaxID=2053492 RepID=UPI00287B0DAD|nr:Rpn family recombination-promoting nuclease/putative transposase [Accumulibacter sp.]MDS4013319.1 Rpn family recombination-promoting nuclease/putative transposase [Accumulibacter sp.]
MRHSIDPKIDCVFKALLGADSNRRLLIHFLNAVLGAALPGPIRQVSILNPYNEREFLDDKLSIVDVKARDDAGQIYQVEIQLLSYAQLPARILYAWADLYSAQLGSGQDYAALRPTYAIWLLAENLLHDDPAYAHSYRLRDENGRILLEHGGIWLLELNKFVAERVETEQQRWLKFFTEGQRLDQTQLPTWMQTDEMRQAMDTLNTFSEKERAYHAYQARQNYLREQRCIQRELEGRQMEAERLRAEAERLQMEAERLQTETERLQMETEQLQTESATLRTEKDALLTEKDVLRTQTETLRTEKGTLLTENEALQAEAETLRIESARERAAREAAVQEKEAALAELARLRALLRDS